MKVTRSMQRDYDQQDAVNTKAKNLVRKKKEQNRRDARMEESLRAGSLPYAPFIMSWLSRKLDKASTRITQEDVQTLLK